MVNVSQRWATNLISGSLSKTMALFGDKNKQTIEELENYYSNKEQKTGMAWAMAFLSLVLTVVVFSGIFFGGRAIYRAVTKDDSKDTSSIADNSASDNTATNPTPGESPAPAPSGDAATTPSLAPAPATSGVVSDQAASTNTPSTTAQSGRGGETPAASSAVAGAATGLPNTGSGPVLIVAPLATLVAGFFAARRKFIKG